MEWNQEVILGQIHEKACVHAVEFVGLSSCVNSFHKNCNTMQSCRVVRVKSDNSEGHIQNCCMIQLSNKESLLRLVVTCHFITGLASTPAHTAMKRGTETYPICDQCYPL